MPCSRDQQIITKIFSRQKITNSWFWRDFRYHVRSVSTLPSIRTSWLWGIFEPPKTSPRNPPQKQISLHPRRSTYPHKKSPKQSPQKKLDNFFQPPKEPPQRKQHTNWFFWDFFWYPSCKTLVAWVIYGMKSYPVVQGLFHEPINGCQVIQCDFFIPDRWRSLDHAKKVTKNCQDSRMMFFFQPNTSFEDVWTPMT